MSSGRRHGIGTAPAPLLAPGSGASRPDRGARTRARGRPAARIAVAVAVVALAACGVPDDPDPRRLDARGVPFGLLEAAPATTTTIPAATTTVPIEVWFLGPDGRLSPVLRFVTEPVTVGKVLNTLLGGVTEEEAAAGLRSAINPSTRQLAVRLEENVARVDLNEAFTQAPIQEQIASLAQVVFTATALPGVLAVRFTLGGSEIEVPKPDNSLASGPVGRDEFAALARPPG